MHGEAPLSLTVGVASEALTALHRFYRVESSVFVTACNPFSQQFTDLDNARRQATLASQLKHQDLFFIDGIGQHLSNQWPGEPSFLVLGISREAAKALAIQHGQNAIIWCGLDAVPELVLLR